MEWLKKIWTYYDKLRQAKIVTTEPIIFLNTLTAVLYYTLSQQYFFNQFSLEVTFGDSDRAMSVLNGSIGCLAVSKLDEYSGFNHTARIVQERSTRLAVYISVSSRLLSVFSTIILGSLSDQFGRKPVFVLVSVGTILQGICALLIVHAGATEYLFVLGAVLVGSFGDVVAILSASFSYIADVSSEKWRTARLGIAEAMAIVAAMISAGVSGIWFEKTSCNIGPPLILYLACQVIIILYTVFFLPETVKVDGKRWKLKRLKNSVRAFQILFGGVEAYRAVLWKLWVALSTIVIAVMANVSYISIIIFFLKELDWNSTNIGLYFFTANGAALIVSIVLLPILVALKIPDYILSLVGVILGCLVYLLLSFSRSTYLIFIIAVTHGMLGLVIPPMRGLISKTVSPEDKGALLFLVGSAEIGFSLISVMFLYVLPKTFEEGVTPGIIFTGVAGLQAFLIPILCSFLMVKCWQKYRGRQSKEDCSDMVELVEHDTSNNEESSTGLLDSIEL